MLVMKCLAQFELKIKNKIIFYIYDSFIQSFDAYIL